MRMLGSDPAQLSTSRVFPFAISRLRPELQQSCDSTSGAAVVLAVTENQSILCREVLLEDLFLCPDDMTLMLSYICCEH